VAGGGLSRAPQFKRSSLGFIRQIVPTLNISSLPVRPHGELGHWLSDDRRYYRYALLCLSDLELAISKLNAAWPGPLSRVARDADVTPELRLLARRRDLLSDSVKVFSAMAVEGFINFYGALRLGDEVYLQHLEFSAIPVKLSALLEHCDKVSLGPAAPLLVLAQAIARRRNELVHPKAEEAADYVPAEQRLGDWIPDVARDAVRDMVSFFNEFVSAVPDAAHLIPRLDEA
jgi:hypothetical protein